MTVRAVIVAFALALAPGCKSSPKQSVAEVAPSNAPVIVRVTPDSGPAGTAYPIEIAIEGRGFSDSTNVVTFGPVTIRDVHSRESRTRIVMYVPKETPGRSEVPPAPLTPGAYELRVSTPGGTTSNAITFRLTREPP